MCVQSLVRELGSHMPCGTVTPPQKKKKPKNYIFKMHLCILKMGEKKKRQSPMFPKSSSFSLYYGGQ